jgi:hypothetical protein
MLKEGRWLRCDGLRGRGTEKEAAGRKEGWARWKRKRGEKEDGLGPTFWSMWSFVQERSKVQCVPEPECVVSGRQGPKKAATAVWVSILSVSI